VGRALDFFSDWSLVAYAAWTLIAWGGMLTSAAVSVLVPVWLATIPFLGIGLVALRRRPARETPTASPRTLRSEDVSPDRLRVLVVVGIGAALVAAFLAGAFPDIPWPLIWAPLFAAVAAAAIGLYLRPDIALAERAGGLAADIFAATVAFGFAAMSLFIVRQSADDAFYVNRAMATAQLDRIPTEDVLITYEQVPPTSGAGIPVDTFSALQGALGRFLDLHGASVAYYLSPPFFTFLATWALWRLQRAWAPRAALACFALGCVYWLFSAQYNLTAGTFFLSRMWQGKVVFVSWVIPTIYLLLSRWLDRRDALTAVLVLCAAVASIGMTGSATFAAPLVFSVGFLALLIRRDWRGLPLVVAAAAIPFLVGYGTTLRYPLVEALTEGEIATPTYVFFQRFGPGFVAAIGVVALATAPWLAQTGAAARLTAAIAALTVFLVAPGVIPAISELVGLTGSLRRTLWVVPFPALVGLLAAIPIARLRFRVPRAALAPGLIAAALLIALGHPVWTSQEGGRSLWQFPPRWKTNTRAVKDARAILARYEGPGPILAEGDVMRAIALVTVHPKAVNPRDWYVSIIDEPGNRTEERGWLIRFVNGKRPHPTPEQVRQALVDLRVDLACLHRWKEEEIAAVQSAGPYREAFSVRGYICFQRESVA
jgi:hypothetical protein